VTRELGKKLDRLLPANETFYNWGWETGLYYYSQRHPPTGVLFYNVLQGGPMAYPLTQRVLRDLVAHPPKLIVSTPWALPQSQPPHPITNWFLHHYDLLPREAADGPFLLYTRREK
jgi:hypothetical protein